MKLLYFLVFVFTSVFTHFSWSQNDVLNHQKYWMARHRLKLHNVVVGDKAGNSIPAGFHNKFDSLAHFGDGIIRLGWYISILTTEWKLLQLHGKNNANTGRELYYALRAVERLDENSENMWSWFNFPYGKLPSEIDKGTGEYLALNPAYFDSSNYAWVPGQILNGEPDGFLVRDDVPYHIRDQLEGIKFVASSHTEGANLSDHRGFLFNEMSQDQLVFLLMGLRFVDEFIPDSYSFNGYFLKNGAKVLCARIMDHVVDSYAREGFADKKPYIINNPHVANFKYEYPDVRRGANMSFYRFPTALIANKIVYNKSYAGYTFSPNQVTGNTYMHSASLGHTSFVLAINLGVSLPKPIFSPNSKNWQDNKTKEYALLATSNFYKQPCSPNSFHYLYEVCMGHSFRRWHIYPLMNHVLFPPTFKYNKKVKSFFDKLKLQTQETLDSYPCTGGFNYGLNNYTPHWGQTNRFFHYYVNANDPKMNDAFTAFKGHGNGEDYMLLYNLFRLAYHGDSTLSAYEELGNQVFEISYPYIESGQFMENLATPGNHFAPSSIYFRSRIEGVVNNSILSGDVSLKSTQSIHLLASNSTYPGFHAEYGSHFLAKIVNGIYCDINGYKSNHNQPFTTLDTLFISDAIAQDSVAIPIRIQDSIPMRSEPINESLSNDFEVKLFPNPTYDQIRVSFLNTPDCIEKLIMIYDLNGKLLMHSAQYEREVSLDVSSLTSSMYVVRIKCDSGLLWQGSFVKL